MPRIICKTPSTGRPVRIHFEELPSGTVTLIEAPDFSVPDPGVKFQPRDPGNAERAIRPGEIFFLTPLYLRNRNTVGPIPVAVQIVSEAAEIAVLGVFEIPIGETVAVPLQGLSLFRRNAAGSFGDRLRLVTGAHEFISAICGAEEKLASEHIEVET